MTLTLRLTGLFLVVQLCACSTFFGDQGVFRGRGKDYLRSGSIKSIEVPAKLESKALSPVYGIPSVETNDEFGDVQSLEGYDTPRPPSVNTDKSGVGVKLQRLGTQRWIFINASTSQVWPRTQNFLSQYDMKPAISKVRDGLIETDWISFKEDLATHSKYRILLQKGIHPDTSEIHILHAQAPKEQGYVQWSTESHDAEREKWLLDELAGVLAQSVNNNSASLLGQNVGGDVKAKLTRFGNEPALRLDLPRRRAWASVSHAFDKEGFKLWAEAKDYDLFYVGYKPFTGKKKRGILRKAFLFWKENPIVSDRPSVSFEEALSHLDDSQAVKARFAQVRGADFRQPLKGANGFFVFIQRHDGYEYVTVFDSFGKSLPGHEAKAMLRVIRRNLI